MAWNSRGGRVFKGFRVGGGRTALPPQTKPAAACWGAASQDNEYEETKSDCVDEHAASTTVDIFILLRQTLALAFHAS